MIETHIGLWADSKEPAWDSLSLPLPFSLSLAEYINIKKSKQILTSPWHVFLPLTCFAMLNIPQLMAVSYSLLLTLWLRLFAAFLSVNFPHFLWNFSCMTYFMWEFTSSSSPSLPSLSVFWLPLPPLAQGMILVGSSGFCPLVIGDIREIQSLSWRRVTLCWLPALVRTPDSVIPQKSNSGLPEASAPAYCCRLSIALLLNMSMTFLYIKTSIIGMFIVVGGM